MTPCNPGTIITVITISLAVLPSLADGAPTTRPPATVTKEMSDVVVAVNKALGLESWPLKGAKPCVDHGTPDTPTKTVSPEETRRCAAASVDKGFRALGKSYILAILMTPVGPGTVVAIGIGDASGFAAHSCDPGRKCLPVRMETTSKWGKRVIDRQATACADEGTIWFPPDRRACPGGDQMPRPAPEPAPKGRPPAAPAPARDAAADSRPISPH